MSGVGKRSVLSELVRVYKSVHTWVGIVCGLALFIAFYAGALTVFKEPLTQWVAAPADSKAIRVPIVEANTLIVDALAASPAAASDFSLDLEGTTERRARMSWQVRARASGDRDESPARYYVAVSLADGSIAADEIRPTAVADFIDTLHRVVGLPVDSDENRWVMGVVAMLYGMALVSGLIVLLPSLSKDLFALRIGKNLKRMWLDAHNVVGLFSLPFHLIMAITALAFAFHDGIYALQDRVIHGGNLRSAFAVGAAPGKADDRRNPADMLPPAELLQRAQALSPTFTPTRLQYTRVTGLRATLRVWGHDDSAHEFRTLGGFVVLDPYSGQVIAADFLPGRQDAAHALISSLFALHMVTFGGVPVKWMYFLLGLAGAWLFYSGNLLWVETRRRKATADAGPSPTQRRDTRLMAAATVGVSLGCVCGISLMLVVSRWLYGHLADPAGAMQFLYYATFFVAIAWAIKFGAGRGSVHLLWFATACTLAIPATSILTWCIPSLGLWSPASAATLGVDATALLGGLCFVRMARATARRVHDGPTDSVWSPHEKYYAPPVK